MRSKVARDTVARAARTAAGGIDQGRDRDESIQVES